MIREVEELVKQKEKSDSEYAQQAEDLIREHVFDTLDILNKRGEGKFSFNSGNGTFFYLFNDQIIHDDTLQSDFEGEHPFSDDALAILSDSAEHIQDLCTIMDTTISFESEIGSHQHTICLLVKAIKVFRNYSEQDFENMIKQLPDYTFQSEYWEKMFRKHLKVGE